MIGTVRHLALIFSAVLDAQSAGGGAFKDDCPRLAVICVSPGQAVFMDDEVVLRFFNVQGDAARFVTSVCGGSLLLGAAGLLHGYKFASHWAFRHFLPSFGAELVADRVVKDRNRISGGGVTAGIDFGLALSVELAGAAVEFE